MKRNLFLKGLSALALGAMTMFTSCNKTSSDVVPQAGIEEGKLRVTTELFFMEADGSVVPLTNDGLRAVTGETSKGAVTGDGVYDYNTDVVMTVTGKGKYILHKFYEKEGKEGFTQDKVINQQSHQATFKIKQDMAFVAVFADPDNQSTLGYQNLKLNGALADFVAPALTGKTVSSGTVSAVGEEITGYRDPSGKLTGFWSVSNPTFKAWNVTTPSANWLTATIEQSTGVVTFRAEPHIGKVPARTTTFKVGKDGSIPSLGKNAWRTITVKQNSYFTDANDPARKITFGEAGAPANIKPEVSGSIPSSGGVLDLTTTDDILKKPMVIHIPTYENGTLLPQDQWVTKPIKVEIGSPADPWLQKTTGDTVKAGTNNTKNSRKTDVVAKFTVDGEEVGATIIKVSQDKRQYRVDVEIQ